jgi:quercetin dioxygenase-like cupin family protein
VVRAVWRRLADLSAFRLPGRTAKEVFSARSTGSRGVALREVHVDGYHPEHPRHAHVHRQTEEILYVLAGSGRTWVEGEIYPLAAGDALLVPAGQRHMTVGDGEDGITLLSFFAHPAPEDDTEELPDVLFPGEGGDGA